VTTQPTAEQLRELLAEAERLRDALVERRRTSPYPWDAAPIGEYNTLLERARAHLPGPPVELPEPLKPPVSGQRLWRTPTDDALQAIERLQAAITTALEACS
jgi:hypothetical protein